MIVRALDINHDWTFGRGKNNFLSGINAVAQTIQTRLLSFLGDCFFSIDSGIDWFNMLGSKNSLALDAAVRAVILNTLGVTSLVELSLNIDNARNIPLVYTVTTSFSSLSNPNGTVTVTTNLLLDENGGIITTEDGNPIGV